MLFVGYFSCVIVAFTTVALWLVGLVNNSTLEKHHHPRPAVAAEEIAPLHLEVAKEASPAKDGVSPVKHHRKPKVFAHQRNNHGYGNASGYADALQNDPRGFFIH
jgi:hypothetical protein